MHCSTCCCGLRRWLTRRDSLAYAELYLSLAMIVRRFDWELYETTLDDVVCKHDFFVAASDLESKGVRATLLSRL
jgi:hypothetical protein